MVAMKNNKLSVTLRDLYEARQMISTLVERTPLVAAAALSEQCGANVFLKMETAQGIGAFKIRGATNRLLRMTNDERARGVVTVSTGNHGRAVAQAAQRAGVKAIVCMSQLVPDNKIVSIRELGAEPRIVGSSQDEAEIEANRLVADHGMTLIHPFDDPLVVAGQGTIGIELLEDLPRIDTFLVGLSGGGLLSGVAIALKAAWPDTRIIGVSMQRGPAMVMSLEAGQPVLVEEELTLADSLGGGIGLQNHCTFELVSALIDETVLLSETQIAEAMRHLYREEGIVSEGAGAVGAGALLHGLVTDLGENVVTIVSGNNVDCATFNKVMAGPTEKP